MGSQLFRNRFRVPSARMQGWDYRSPGFYAVTICVEERVCCLGEILEGRAARSRLGDVAAEEWLRIPKVHPHVILDEWLVMPDHIHGILFLQEETASPRFPGLLTTGSLGVVVGQFKKRATRRIRARWSPGFSWQERFFDQFLRDEDTLNSYRAYIRENPQRWKPPGDA